MKILAVTLFSLILLYSPSSKAEVKTVSEAQKKEFLSLLIELLPEALQKLQDQQITEQIEKNKETIEKNHSLLFKDARDFVIGNPKGSKVMAVFMDPYCGHCRKFHNTLNQALDFSKNPELKNLKVILKDFPIFGESSELSVKAMLAAKMQGKYLELQKVILRQEKPITLKEIKKIATSIGINPDRLIKDMESDKVKATIESNKTLANLLEINGTPTIVLEDTVIPGEFTIDEIKKIIGEEKEHDPSES